MSSTKESDTRYTFSLAGSTADINPSINWVVNGQAVQGSSTLSYTFPGNGNYTVVANYKTLCNENASVSTSVNVAIRTCQQPTGIFAQSSSLNQITYALSNYVASDISSVEWRITNSAGATVGNATGETFPVTYSVSGNYSIIANIRTQCGQSVSLALPVSYQVTALSTLEKMWDRTFGSSGSDVITSIIKTNDGGYLLGGSSPSPAGGEKSQNSFGAGDYWVVKINPDGSKAWDATFGGSGEEGLTCMAATPDGGYILGGYSYSNLSGNKTDYTRGGSDYWIVKINAFGAKQWDKAYGGSLDDRLNSVVANTDGSFILVGNSSSGANNDKTQSLRGTGDIWALRINPDRSIVWNTTFGGDGYDQAAKIIPSNDGNYYIGGSSSSGAGSFKSEPHRGGGSDYWVIKMSAAGSRLWDKTAGGSGTDLLKSITLAADGGVVLAGESDSNASNEKSENSRGGVDYWVTKISTNGVREWDETFGGTGFDGASEIITTPQGTFIVAGTSDSNRSNDKSEDSKGNIDMWVLHLKTTGQRLTDKTFGGSAGDGVSAMTTTQDNMVLIGGGSNSNKSGDKNSNSYGAVDYWVVKVKY